MYVVLEIQQLAEEQVSVLTFAFSDWGDANAKYHTILSVAAKTQLLCHSAVILSEDGSLLKADSFRNIQNEEPQPVI